jgi:hypothetical protein
MSGLHRSGLVGSAGKVRIVSRSGQDPVHRILTMETTPDMGIVLL